MSDLGGFLAVSYLAEHVFTNALEALWRSEWENASGAAQWNADTPFGRLEALGGVSLDKPGMSFHSAANAVRIHVTGRSRAELTLTGNGVGGVFIAFDAVVSLPVIVTQEGLFKKAVVDLSGFILDSSQLLLTWFDGPHDSNAESALLSPEARKSLTNEVRKRAARYLTFRLPTDQVYLAELAVMTKGIPGSIIITPLIKLGGVRILDGWFAIGFDATSSVGQTHGNAAAIGPPPDAPPPGTAPMPQADPGVGSFRLIVDPALMVIYLQVNAKFALIFASATRPNLHPNTEAIGVALEDDTIVLTVTGTVDAPDPFPGQLPFFANIRIRPFIPKDTGTVYASIKPDVLVDAPWFLTVLGIIIDFFGGDTFAQLWRANQSVMPVLFKVAIKHQKVPETDVVYASIEGRQIAIRPDLLSIYGEASFTTPYSEHNLVPKPTVWTTVWIRERFLQLSPTDRLLIVDPTFRIHYSIKRGSNGDEVVSGITWSGTQELIGEKVDLWDDANILEVTYIVELVAERPPGTEVARHVASIAVLDPFDRSHPFVRWRKQHYYTGGPLTPTPILSAIHRTAIRERCKFCDVREWRFNMPYTMQALDDLPATEEDGFSTRLCKYCFPNS